MGDMLAKKGNVPEEYKKAYDEDVNATAGGIDIRFPRLKIDHHNAKFIIPDSSGGKSIDKIKGVILKHQRVNYLFDPKDTETLLCFSINGIEPVMMEDKTPESTNCATCPKNKFGSGEGRRKLCKNSILIHFIMEKDSIPYTIMVPPTSIKEYNTYISNLLAEKIPANAVITEFSLTRKEKGSYVWSSLVPKNIGLLEVDKWIGLRKVRSKFIKAIDMQQAEAIKAEADITTDEDEPAPF